MPVLKCSNGKYKIGKGPCMYTSKASAERAYKGYLGHKYGESMSKAQSLLNICEYKLSESGPEEFLFTPGDFQFSDNDSIIRDKMMRANLTYMKIPLGSKLAKEYENLVHHVLAKAKGADNEMWKFHDKHKH